MPILLLGSRSTTDHTHTRRTAPHPPSKAHSPTHTPPAPHNVRHRRVGRVQRRGPVRADAARQVRQRGACADPDRILGHQAPCNSQYFCCPRFEFATAQGFLEFHKDPYNTALHLVTTPFAIVAAICAINALTKASRVPVSATLCVGYTAALAVLPHYRLPCEFADTIVYCAVAMAGMACLASICDFSLYVSVPLMVLGYVGQVLCRAGPAVARLS
eukprot:SAG31_NODE_23_length_33717_cov_17.863585_18_plen_216_part_00